MKSKLPTGPLLTGDVSPSPLDPSDNGLKVMHYANKQPCYKNANNAQIYPQVLTYPEILLHCLNAECISHSVLSQG